MYILLLCWRYLRTRWIALASIVSVMLGVATMIVVNAVMAGFTREMQNRIHGILSDVVFESRSLNGFYDPDWHVARIREVAGDQIAATTVTVAVPAMLNFQYHGNWVTRPVQLIGIDERTQSLAGDFGKYLQHPENRRQMSFLLRESGYDARDPLGGDKPMNRPQMAEAGWRQRRRWGAVVRQRRAFEAQFQQAPTPDQSPVDPAADETAVADPSAAGAPQFGPQDASPPEADAIENPFGEPEDAGQLMDPEREQATGAVLGLAMASSHVANGEERLLIVPGDDVKLTFPNTALPPQAANDIFTVVDFYQSKMSEYDSSFVFIPLRKLQELRGMIEPRTGIGFATSIQIKLRDESQGDLVREKLRAAFAPEAYLISTWRDKQGPLLAAVQMETAILNVLLFMIIAVAGFGILAIFFMIVVEKTRDIGILKSLGASGRGIMGIFLGYGLSLGMVGSGVGLASGLLFVFYINEIAGVLSLITGHEVFDPDIYYFSRIPTIIDPVTIGWIVLGAMAIAVLASILPARRASRLHPVEALRYE